ncbi:PREDICTED: uncharacterized protein LOC107192980 [Dufourea novaeangliae]|uniref:Uncharacterized protein n=1 Tax=Dufourea novaeangliae TaxID=178035 RepID=A0A154NYG8_DUFNO|nr:PREDICTED: uncharacterized protein LOC107192980 [Dufourea novaeangliae]KZC04667.1 hypothetical protein WN55_09466 [Dufourea novaeangliae]
MFRSKRIEVYRGFRDGKWTTKDKLDQYRGILKLYDREKKLRLQDAAKLKKRISWQLGSFREDVKKYHQLVSGSKDRAHNLLQDRKDLRLKCRGQRTEHIYTIIYEDNHQKRRQLDKLRYEKRRKLKRCFELQLEHAELFDSYAREREVPWTQDLTQQRLVARYQQSIAKQNAARAINITYTSMLEILREDAVHYEALLDLLKQDRRSQCEVILAATIMGQLAVEESDDIAGKCKEITRKVWNNMKERERSLAFIRGQVEDLWSYAQSLIRTESETMFTMEVRRASIASNGSLEKQIKSLEGVFDKVKESLLVRSYRELLSRLEEQMKQRTRLLEQFNRNVKERDSLSSQKNEALSTLTEIEHTIVAGVEEYKTDKRTLLEQIVMQKQRQLEHKNLRKVRGELLMDIRAALQNMVAMLVCVRRGTIRTPKKQTDKRPTKDGKDDTEELEAVLPIMEKIETEGLALLSTVSRKVGALFGMSNFEFDEDRDDRAKDLYQTYVSDYNSRLKYKDEGVEPTGLIVEHEAIDSSILTRADIKFRSRQAVEAYVRLE